jgi:uncharacterized iron-regulated membrane protein
MTTQTSTKPVKIATTKEPSEPRSLRRMALRRFLRHRMALTGIMILTGIILYVVIGSMIFTEQYANYNDTTKRLQAPTWGTDGPQPRFEDIVAPPTYKIHILDAAVAPQVDRHLMGRFHS